MGQSVEEPSVFELLLLVILMSDIYGNGHLLHPQHRHVLTFQHLIIEHIEMFSDAEHGTLDTMMGVRFFVANDLSIVLKMSTYQRFNMSTSQ